MLTAFFDDSGTHEASDVVLVAGIFGSEGRMNALDKSWARHLETPLCGRKEKITRFHAFECDQSRGEFTGWSRTETDYFRYLLRTTIIDSSVAAYGIACSRKDYDELIVDDLRIILGSPEGFCINQCFVRSLQWVQSNSYDSEMEFVFDSRPSPIQRYAGTVYDAFSKWILSPPILCGYSFESSKARLPLQAADLIAWELNQYATAILKHGLSTSAPKEILHLRKNMDFQAQIATRQSIVKLRNFWLTEYQNKPDLFRQMANHFSLFDPKAPDYSHLS